MTSEISSFFAGAKGQRIGWTLLHFLWQGTVVAAVLATALRCMQRGSAQARYVTACFALVVLAALPVITAVQLPQTLIAATPKLPATPTLQIHRPVDTAPLESLKPAIQNIASPSAPVAAAASSQLRISWRDRIHLWIEMSLPWVVAIWVIGVVALSLWQVSGWLLVQRIRRLGMPLTQTDIIETFGRLRTRLAVMLPVKILESTLVQTPIVIGWLRPAILLPASVLTGLSREQLEAILAHELAHVRRFDCLTRMFQAVVETVLFFHPAVWWVSRQINQESEICCDEWALKVCPDRRQYASALAMFAGAVDRTGWSVAASGGKLLPRLRRIMGISPQRSMGRTLLSAMAALMVVVAVIVVSRTYGAKGAESAAATQPMSPSDAKVAIQGIVVDEKGKPVADVTIDTSTPPPKAPGFTQPSARTGADGRFTLYVDPPDQVSFRFLRARTADGSRQGFLDRGVNSVPEMPRDVKIDLKPPRDFAITVKDEKGAPVAGALAAAAVTQQVVGEAISDAEGRAILRVPADAPLEYIYVIKAGVGLDYFAFRQKYSAHTDPYHLADDFAGPVAFVLNGTRAITIAAQDEQHQPIAGARISPWIVEKPKKGALFNLSVLHRFDQFTNVQGKAQFLVIPADNVQSVVFWVDHDGFTRRRCEWDGTTELMATLPRKIHLTGRVVGEDGRAVGGAAVRIGGAGYVGDDCRVTVESQADGAFATDIDAEQYYLLVAQKDHQVSAAYTQIIRKEPPAAPIELKLKAGVRVFGKITGGPDNKPMANLYAQLRLEDNSYRKLPVEQQFPGPTRGRKSIEPGVSQVAQANRDGQFEFYACPGDYEMSSVSGFDQARKRFTLDDKEMEVPIHFENAVQPSLLHGHVVLADKPDTAVAGATISAQHVDDVMREGTTDNSGNFEIWGGRVDMYVCVTSADHKLGAIVLVKASDEHVTFPLAPAASVHGRLLDSAGKPWAHQTLNYGILMQSSPVQPVGAPGSPAHVMFMNNFGGRLTTDGDGAFSVDGLVPGHEYSFIITTPGEPLAKRLQTIARITPDSGKPIDLGDVSAAPVPARATLPAIPSP